MERILIKNVVCAWLKVNPNIIFCQTFNRLNTDVGIGLKRWYCSLTILKEKTNLSGTIFLQCNNDIGLDQVQKLHLEGPKFKKLDKTDRKNILASILPKEEGTDGEKTASLATNIIRGFGELFPDETTPDELYDGVRYADLPIVHVKCSRNNTIMSLADSKGNTKFKRSCGMEGFKNAKKGTNIAAQITAQSLGVKILEKGFKNVRIAVRGLGPGRMSSMEGLSLSGVNVVSITDVTPISFYISPRPRKAKK